MLLEVTLTTLPYDSGVGLQEHRKRLTDLRTTLRQEVARDIRISLRRDIRRELNSELRMVKGEQLNILLAGHFDRGKQTSNAITGW